MKQLKSENYNLKMENTKIKETLDQLVTDH
jgi:hypothetical protein